MEMNGSSQSSASASGAPSGPTTPQQVAAAAAALAASRAASVSAAMRSVFGAKQQAALASAMMNASVNAAASKAAAAAVARAVPSPHSAQPLKPSPLAVAPPAAATTSVVVMPSSFDGLPVLPPHAASCAVDTATARLASLACEAHDVPRDGAVELYGEPTTRAAVRAALVAHYAATNQLSSTSSNDRENGCAVSEMTLRMDTELEMLRRQCFAERNARWQFSTPDQFAPVAEPAHEPVWVAEPYVGPRRQTLLLRKYHEHQRLHANDKPNGASIASDPMLADHEALLRSLVGVESVRERAWPPKEFMAKSNTKPSRGGSGANALHNNANRTSSGKKKPVGMVGVVDETPVTARVCSECHTQSSALWRTRPRAATVGTTPVGATPASVEEEDVCLPCYYKTQRRDLFDRKAAEKARRIKEEAARAAAEARALKKQQQQMQKKIKKLQQLQQHQQDEFEASEVKSEDAGVDVIKQEEDDAMVIRPIKLTRRESVTGAASATTHHHDALDRELSAAALAAAAATVAEDKKKREKKSKKDKKKKKKKKKKKASSDGWDDSDSDDDGAASSVIMPSPPQRQMDGFVYADRTAEQLSSALDRAAYDLHEDDSRSIADSVSTEPLVVESSKSESKSKKRGAASTPAATSSRSASSKKRKSTDSVVDAPPAVPPTPTERSRGSRARSSSTAIAAAPAAVAIATAVPVTPSGRKRARPTKKESARERELRALGQYCPVCNMTYEEDDASPFVCCDSCEMWVHAACDSSLSPEALAALGESNEKYICPLCGGR